MKTETVAPIQIDGRPVGPGHPVYVVAELSANHGHRLERALETIQAAAAAGADAIKIQTYTADTLTIDCDNEHFVIRGTGWSGRTLYDLYQEAFTPWEWHAELQRAAADSGLHFFSTPFDDTAVAFLEGLNVPVFKIASFESVDTELLRCVARSGRPVILSTGMASLSEIDEAVSTLRRHGAGGIALLKCTSAYPAPASSMNLRTIQHLADAFGVPVGLSDHTLGFAAAVAAVTLGACIVEKHFTLSRAAGGPDAAFSAEPAEFAAMVQAIRVAEAAAGRVHYGPTDDEAPSLVFRRSLFVVRDVRAGEPFTRDNVRSIRPGYGLPVKYLPEVLGRAAASDIARGTPLEWQHLGSLQGAVPVGGGKS